MTIILNLDLIDKLNFFNILTTSISFYTFVYNTRNMKTITISDDVYEKLVRIKGKKSFSAIIDELIKRNVEKRIDMLIKSAERTGYEDELERISKEIRKSFRVRF